MADSLKKFSIARGQVIQEGFVFIFCSSQSDFKSFLTIATTVKHYHFWKHGTMFEIQRKCTAHRFQARRELM